MKKRILGVLLACVLALGTLPAVQAAGLPASPEDVWGMDGVFVQLNGAFLTFPDAQPEIRNGRVMAPFRTIAETLGMEVAFREGAIAASNDAVQLRFRVGEASYWKSTGDGAPSTAAPMDAAPYIKAGRTYVPVRFFAEALGLQVEWCENTVVILDREQLTAQVDRDFTILNKALAQKADLDSGKVTRTAFELAMQLTLLDSLDGDKTCPTTLHVVSDRLGQSAHLTIQMDVRKFVDLLLDALADNPWYPEEEQSALLFETIRKAADAGDFEMIYNADTETLYCKSAMLVELAKAYTPLDVQNIDGQKIWFQIALEGMDEELSEMQANGLALPQGVTVGELLYDETAYPLTRAEQLETSHAALRLLVGDDAFTAAGGTHTVRFDVKPQDTDPVAAALAEYGIVSLRGTLTVPDSGVLACDLSGRMETFLNAAEFTVKGSYRADRLHLDVTAHVRNTAKLALSMDASLTQPDVSLPDAPPADELVLNLTSLMGTDAIFAP